MPKLTINDQEVEVAPGTSIIQAAEQIGIEIPRFCYHDKLSVPANCRMCLVEVEGGPPKPVASCAMACGDGMVVKTDTEMVKKARRGVMEMLLINHPLDCPICDQGGECDLQDQAMAYGYDRSRYHENKRAVKDKPLGPLIKTIMTRCINCTRCVRFGEEIGGMTELGQLNRGEDAEIGTFIEEAVSSELSGNMIDICPVGALTSKPYAFKVRTWELNKTQSIDVHDAVGSNIRVDSKGREVMRILPRLHEDINEEWINDRTRFAYDGLQKNRLDRPYIKDSTTRKLRPCSWEEALDVAADKIKTYENDNIAAYVGDLSEAESIYSLKQLMDKKGVQNIECRTDGAKYDASNKGSYRFNTSIAGIEEADAILMVGTFPRHEATMINARIRKTWLENRIPIGVIGPEDDFTYPTKFLGSDLKALEGLLKEKSEFSKKLEMAEKPMIILGNDLFKRDDIDAILATVQKLCDQFDIITDDWNGYNVIQLAASRVAALEMDFVPSKEFDLNEMGLVYLLDVDSPEVIQNINPHAFVIYQGSHGDIGAHRADLILPGATYTEKDGIYMNTEGRAQRGRRAVFPPGEAREDWKIIRAISDRCDLSIEYKDLSEVRSSLINDYPALGCYDDIQIVKLKKFKASKAKISDQPLTYAIDNFYLTNPITRASETMRKCSDQLLKEDVPEAAE
ncbi:MAG: NADH-quinone oxidoreductase subunit NuoG [Pseudomonadota bacterium]